MPGDVLATIDAAIEQRCACLCGEPITDRSPDPYFAGERCAMRGYARQDAVMLPRVVVQQHEPVLVQLQRLFEQFAYHLRDWLHELSVALRPTIAAIHEFARQVHAATPPVHGPPIPPAWPRQHGYALEPLRPPRQITPPHGWHYHISAGTRRMYRHR